MFYLLRFELNLHVVTPAKFQSLKIITHHLTLTDNCQLSYALALPIRQWFNVFRFLLRVVPWGCYCGLIPKREESASIRLAITRHSTYTSLSQYFSEWLWKGTKGCIGNYNFAEKWNVLQARRNRGDWAGCSPPP